MVSPYFELKRLAFNVLKFKCLINSSAHLITLLFSVLGSKCRKGNVSKDNSIKTTHSTQVESLINVQQSFKSVEIN
jgi:hypothetical protein